MAVAVAVAAAVALAVAVVVVVIVAIVVAVAMVVAAAVAVAMLMAVAVVVAAARARQAACAMLGVLVLAAWQCLHGPAPAKQPARRSRACGEGLTLNIINIEWQAQCEKWRPALAACRSGSLLGWNLRRSGAAR